MTETSHTPPERTLTIIDVGHGNSAVLACDSAVVVIDAGPPKAGLLEYLLQQGIDRIDTVLISHADEDHLGGLTALLSDRRFHVGCVRSNTDSSQGSAIWNDLLCVLNDAGDVDFEPCLTANDEFSLDDDGILVDVLGPSTYLAGKGPGSTDRRGRRLRSHSVSAVMRISADGKHVALLPGDLDEIGLDDLLENARDVTAPILVFPHHGGSAGSTATSERLSRSLCDAVSPSTIVFSTGRNRVRNPRPEVMKTVCQALPNVRVLCTQLSEHCATATPEENPPHLSDVFCKGREDRECCAGSIVVDLDDPDSILPRRSDLQAFISVHAPTALCQDAQAGNTTTGTEKPDLVRASRPRSDLVGHLTRVSPFFDLGAPRAPYRAASTSARAT